MWTDEARTGELILGAVEEPVVQRLLYQAQMHVENFRSSRERLQESFETLLFHDFARTQSCHMTEGIFGADVHSAKMESAKIRVWGFLLNTVTAGHKFLRCLVNARRKHRAPEWAALREDLRTLPDLFRKTRNFLEHLDEMVAEGTVTTMDDCRFSRHGILQYSDNGRIVEFSFTADSLARVERIWGKVIELLQEWKKEADRESSV